MRTVIKSFFSGFAGLNLRMYEDQRILIGELSRVFGIHGAAASTFVYTHDGADLKSERDLAVLEQDLVVVLRERMTLVERAQVAEQLYRELSLDTDPMYHSLWRYGQLMVIGALLTGIPCWFESGHPVLGLAILKKKISPASKAWLFIETYDKEINNSHNNGGNIE